MNPFLRKVIQAARLTRIGQVSEATATLQRALAKAMSLPENLAAGIAPVAKSPAAATTGRPDRPTGGTDAREGVGEGRFTSGSYSGPEGERSYKLFVPGPAAPGRRPLIVMLHGCKQNPDDFAAGTRMNELAAGHGCCVLYPAQAARSNAQRCWNWFSPGDQHRGRGEPALLAGMTRQVVASESIDPSRVFVAGLSAGGAMAAILAREYPDLYAAAGIHSGLPAGAAHDVGSAFAAMKGGSMPRAESSRGRDAEPNERRAVPVIVFHGDADATVAPANGDAVVAAALAVAGASATPTATTHGVSASGERAYTHTVWRDSAGGTRSPSRAELWRIAAAPHAWSGGSSAGSYTDPGGPDASREMLRFFLEHPLQTASHPAHA